jgi:hypothetical protein
MRICQHFQGTRKGSLGKNSAPMLSSLPIEPSQSQIGTSIATEYPTKSLKARGFNYLLKEFVLTDMRNDLHLYQMQKNVG